jgi:hypothetical protein
MLPNRSVQKRRELRAQQGEYEQVAQGRRQPMRAVCPKVRIASDLDATSWTDARFLRHIKAFQISAVPRRQDSLLRFRLRQGSCRLGCNVTRERTNSPLRDKSSAGISIFQRGKGSLVSPNSDLSRAVALESPPAARFFLPDWRTLGSAMRAALSLFSERCSSLALGVGSCLSVECPQYGSRSAAAYRCWERCYLDFSAVRYICRVGVRRPYRRESFSWPWFIC